MSITDYWRTMADINDLLADNRTGETKPNCGYVLSSGVVFTDSCESCHAVSGR